MTISAESALLLGLQFNLNELSKIITATQINGIDHYTFGTEKTNRELVQEFIGTLMLDFGKLYFHSVVDQQKIIEELNKIEAENNKIKSQAHRTSHLTLVPKNQS